MSGTDLRKRLMAILVADVAGYSRLMAGDELATVASLDAARSVFRTQIESHQGRVIDMAGDSVLAVFETAAGAVTAALAIQQELAAVSSSIPEERRMRATARCMATGSTSQHGLKDWPSPEGLRSLRRFAVCSVAR
ncbi:MAG: hypothetical protein HYW03_07360 [Deltaproteobacteria bacterium]|nr:hypothetical protein [Deltaproteobacteria bacterium]